MKKLHLILLIAFLTTFSNLQAQDSRFTVISYGGIGFATLDNQNSANYDLNVNTAEFTLHYRIGTSVGVGGGLALDTFSGNAFNETGNYYHERSSIRIPLLVTYTYGISDKVTLYGSIGPYGRKILSEDIDTTGLLTSFNTYDGWNFGIQSSLNIGYSLNENLMLGFTINNQGDITNVESIGNGVNSSTPEEQKTKAMYTIGLSFAFKF